MYVRIAMCTYIYKLYLDRILVVLNPIVGSFESACAMYYDDHGAILRNWHMGNTMKHHVSFWHCILFYACP